MLFQDSEGKIVHSHIINDKNSGQYQFESSNLNPGIYFCTLWINGKLSDKRLLVLSKWWEIENTKSTNTD